MIDAVIVFGLLVAVVSGLIWFHAYAWRRESRCLRTRFHAEDMAFWASWDAMATRLGCSPTPVEPPPPPDDGRDGLRALGDIPRGWVFLAKTLYRSLPK